MHEKKTNKKSVFFLQAKPSFTATHCLLICLLLLLTGVSNLSAQQVPLPGAAITKYLDPLPHFAGTRVNTVCNGVSTPLTISVHEFQQRVLSSDFVYPAPFTGTYVWGYAINDGKKTYGPHYPAFTIETQRGLPLTVTYVNDLPIQPFLQQYLLIDQTLHWADPLNMMQMDMMQSREPYAGPPPIVTHLHGAEVPSEYDGGPDQWFTPDGLHGSAYRSLYPTLPNAAVYWYPNQQEGTTLWYHDHTLGATRINVYAGLAGFYFLRDPAREPGNLPGGPFDKLVKDFSNPDQPQCIKAEIEIAIQDRMFDTNGQLFFPSEGINPEHPFWIPEFFGDTIVVNGRTWPYLRVEPRRYRFRFLDGSNSRFYRMWLENSATGTPGPVFWQIGTDGGLLDRPVKLDPQAANPGFLFMAPGERADIIIDFKDFAGQTLTLRNNAPAPFPDGDDPDPGTTGQIMQFRVETSLSNPPDYSFNPASGYGLRMPMQRLTPEPATVTTRQLTLNEVMGENGPLEILVNNTKWNGKRPNGTPIPGSKADGRGNYLTELPRVGETEIWEIINLTADTHPIHLHLVQFQLLSRQDFDITAYGDAYAARFPGGEFIPAYGPPALYFILNTDFAYGGNPPISSYLQGTPSPPEPNEAGWKDTVKMNPGQVTRIAVRFARQNYLPGRSPFPFDPTTGPGYVWHCHIIDHEDNEMMRPYNLVY